MKIDRILQPGDWRKAAALLGNEQLPTDDLAERSLSLWGAFEGENLSGVIGLEECGAFGLLRSLVVEHDRRDNGLARRLVGHAKVEAANRGYPAVYLLTETAGQFFLHMGFEGSDRDKAPQPIRQSAQFRHLCPATASLMRWSPSSRRSVRRVDLPC